MHVGGVIISHRKLGAFSRFPIECHFSLDPLTQTAEFDSECYHLKVYKYPCLTHVPVIYYGVSFGGLIMTDAEVLHNDKKVCWLASSVVNR